MSDNLDLDSLLTESVELHSAKQSLKTARKQLASGLTNGETRAEIEAKIREWEAKSEWKPAAVVAMFTTQVCKCGSRHTLFAGIFQRQTHRTSTASRWVAERTPAHLNLPKEQKHSDVDVAFCLCCVEAQGFPPPTPFQTAFPVTRSFL